MQEAVDEGKTEDDEVVGKVINSSKSYYIVFQIGFVVSYEEMNQYLDSKYLNLTYFGFLQETVIKVSTSQVIRWKKDEGGIIHQLPSIT